ncbi:ABC transporter permease, partial [Pseudomonas syringae pv. actinidiae ICMP 18804]
EASGGLLQRRLGLPDATTLILEGLLFTNLLLWEADLSTFLLALLAGAIRVGTPFLFVSLGECLTEKSGRINLGLEGILVAGAMSGYAVA